MGKQTTMISSSHNVNTTTQQQHEVLSPLPTMMSKFIAESAIKTYDSLQTEDERTIFLNTLRQEMRSALEGKEPGHLDDLDSSSVSVINFLVKTMKCTFDSINGEKERVVFV